MYTLLSIICARVSASQNMVKIKPYLKSTLASLHGEPATLRQVDLEGHTSIKIVNKKMIA